jgi:MFS family permease
LALGIATTMTPVAFVLFARSVTHSFASASLVLAASTAGGLLFGPARGRLVDRFGPRDAVLFLAVPDIATDGGGPLTQFKLRRVSVTDG